MRVLIIDNNDSFTYNLTQLVAAPHLQYSVVSNQVDLGTIEKFQPTHIILSPGPGTVEKDEDFGVCRSVLRSFTGRTPILGICLGHQGIGFYYGMKVVRAPEICHGKIRRIQITTQSTLYEGLPQSFQVMRYHSLAVEPTPISDRHLLVTSRSDDGAVMSLEHRELSVFGMQYHPESISTPLGKDILHRFLLQRGGNKSSSLLFPTNSGRQAA